MKQYLSALALCLLMVNASAAQAGGWLQARGACYAKVHDRIVIGAKAYSAEGLRDMQDVPSYQDHSLQLYGECGLSEWVTLTLAAAPIGYAKSTRSTFYVGPLSAGARIGLKRSGRLRVAASFALGIDAGVGDRPIAESYFDAQDGKRQLAIYQPTFDSMFAVGLVEAGLGFTLGSLPSYLSVALGSRFNSAAGIDHALLAQLQWGLSFFSGALGTDLHFQLYEPYGAAVTITNTAGAGQTRYLGMGLSFSYWLIKQLALFVTVDGVFYAESNAATPALSVGIETRFSLL